MKNYFTYLLLTAILLTAEAASAQLKVGNNPGTIGTSSLLELEHPSKALLLTRVHDTTRSYITTPVNGMIVYDSARACVTAFQNGSWSPCAGSCPGNGGGDTTGGAFTGLRFKSIVNAQTPIENSIQEFETMGVTLAGNLYGWSNRNFGFMSSVKPGSPQPNTVGALYSPYFIDDARWNGKVKKAIIGELRYGVLTTTGNLYMWGYPSEGSFGNGYQQSAANNQQSNPIYTPVQIPPPGSSTGYIDVAGGDDDYSFCVDNTGHAWWTGGKEPAPFGGSTEGFGAVSTPQSTWQPIAAPPGGATYTKIWTDKQSYDSYPVAYMEASDGNYYATGTNFFGIFGSGSSPAVISNTGPAHPGIGSSGVYKMNFPTGTVITRIINTGLHCLALTSTGQVYFWGIYNGNGGNTGYAIVNHTAPPIVLNSMAGAVVYTDPSGFLDTVFASPVLAQLPPAETAFTGIGSDDNQLSFLSCASGKSYVIGTVNGDGNNGELAISGAVITPPFNSSTAITYTTYTRVHALDGISNAHIEEYQLLTSFWLTGDGTYYCFGRNIYDEGTGLAQASGDLPLATPLMSGFVDHLTSFYNTSGTYFYYNPSPGPGY